MAGTAQGLVKAFPYMDKTDRDIFSYINKTNFEIFSDIDKLPLPGLACSDTDNPDTKIFPYVDRSNCVIFSNIDNADFPVKLFCDFAAGITCEEHDGGEGKQGKEDFFHSN